MHRPAEADCGAPRRHAMTPPAPDPCAAAVTAAARDVARASERVRDVDFLSKGEISVRLSGVPRAATQPCSSLPRSLWPSAWLRCCGRVLPASCLHIPTLTSVRPCSSMHSCCVDLHPHPYQNGSSCCMSSASRICAPRSACELPASPWIAVQFYQRSQDFKMRHGGCVAAVQQALQQLQV